MARFFRPLPPKYPQKNYAGLGRVGELLVKLWGDSYNFDIAESEYDNQIALPHSNVKGSG